MGKEKIEAAQQKSTTCATDLSFLPDNEFVELVWENGQIMMQGQSSKVRKSPVSSSFQLHTPRIRERDIGNATTSKMGKFGSIESIFSDIAVSGPSDEIGLNQDYDMVPWLNYPVDDYCSELLPELSGVTVNEPSNQNNFSLIDCDQAVKDSRNGASLEQGNASIPSLGSGVSDLISSNNRKKMQNQDSGMPTINSTLLNFSHFLRPAATATATAKANLPNIVSVETMRVNDKGCSASVSNHAKSTHIDPNNGLEKEMDFHSQAKLLSANVDSKPLVTNPLEECQEDAVKIDISPNQALGGSATKGVPESEKTVEPVIASSSVCSGNIVGRASNVLTKNLKRKCVDTEESEWQSDDVEEESVVVKKATCARGGTGSKRSRAAEVHNLSERRRRDRINEKMRALQELIPNCNKVDKSSMLDEAIEYLKTLQLQVQIMSMGAGLYMPPMMLPTGMQHIHAPHLPHFSPMGVGMRMGMGMGFGMGSHFPFPSAPTAFQGIGGSNLMGFGHPAQGLPVAVSGSPFVPLSARPPINSGVGLNASKMGVHVDISNGTPRLNPKGLIQNSNSPVMDNADASTSMQQTSSQFQETNEGFDQSDLLQKNDRVPDLGGSAAVNSTKGNDTVPRGAAACD